MDVARQREGVPLVLPAGWHSAPGLLVVAALVAAAPAASGAVPGPEGAGGLTYLEVDQLSAPDPDSSDYFADAVALSGDTAVCGTPLKNVVDSGSGAAYFYHRSPGTDQWLFEAKRFPADSERFDLFSSQVSIDGDTALIGSQFDDHGVEASGSAYVFERIGGVWTEVAKLTGDVPGASDFFGWTVSIDGDTAVVGVPNDDDLGQDSGSAYVFQADEGGPGNWGLVTKLLADDGQEEDVFGWAVGISGERIAVAAAQRTVSAWVPEGIAITGPGAVYLFERDLGGPDNWGQRKKLVAAEAVDGDAVGWSVAISGETLVAGGVFHGGGADFGGGAWVFEKDRGGSDNWGEVLRLLPDDIAASDHFGESVSIWADTILVGSYLDDDHGDASGSAYVFERHFGGKSQWGQAAKVTASDAEGATEFGWTVANEGARLLVGAPAYSIGIGKAYVFEADIGGAAFGVDPWRVVCRNDDTGQTVALGLAGQEGWSCEGAGLSASEGDRITQRLLGVATGSDVVGTVSGLDGRRVVCANRTTGDSASVDLTGITSWDCTAAGLAASPGDRLAITSRGNSGN